MEILVIFPGRRFVFRLRPGLPELPFPAIFLRAKILVKKINTLVREHPKTPLADQGELPQCAHWG